MFEFHGWATIRVPYPDIDPARRRESEAVTVARLREAIARAATSSRCSTCGRPATS